MSLQRAHSSNIYNFSTVGGVADHLLPGELHQPDQRPDLQAALLQTGDAVPGRPEHLIRKAFSGYGYPTYGPVPTKPSSIFVDSFERTNPYPYSPSKAVSLLQANGWTVNAGGVSTCTSPGTGTGQCGAGVPQGAKASFSLEYVERDPVPGPARWRSSRRTSRWRALRSISAPPRSTRSSPMRLPARPDAMQPGTWSSGAMAGSTHPTIARPAMNSGRAPGRRHRAGLRLRQRRLLRPAGRAMTSSRPSPAATCRPCTPTRTTSPNSFRSSGCRSVTGS